MAGVWTSVCVMFPALDAKVAGWGQDPQDDHGVFLQRYVLFGDLHLGPHVRLFGELYSALENGRAGPSNPIDENELGFQQAFLDLAAPLATPASLPAPRIRPFGQRIIARYLAPPRVRRVSEPINTARSCSSTCRRMQHEGERRRFGRSVRVAVLAAEALPVRGDLA
jgi:hypothetical protein